MCRTHSQPLVCDGEGVWRPLVVLSVVLVASVAQGAACCMSSSVLGVGRLAIWETAAVGTQLGWAHTAGRSDSLGHWRGLETGTLEDEARLDVWGIVRLAETVELNARVPWVLGVRTGSLRETSVGGGLGDVSLGVRWDLLRLGDYVELPGVAVLAGVVGPTGRRPEDALDSLGASATGRGSWQLSLGLAVEKAVAPWFVRLDGAFTWSAPFRRVDLPGWQQFGPSLQAGVSGGFEAWADRLVLAASLRYEHEWDLNLDGATVAQSAASTLSVVVSASLKVATHWTVSASATSDVLNRLGVGQNRPERLGISFGGRYAFF